jgi:uncharacterized protein (TIGR03085 family)
VLSVSTWAQDERAVLVDLLRSLGPAADVLPAGWVTADLAAHLYVRERRPDAALGVVVPGPAAAYTSRVMASVLRVSGYDQVVDVLAAGPPRPLRMIDEQMNLMEFFVHVEDVRRAQASASAAARSLPVAMERDLFARLKTLLRLSSLRVRGIQIDLVAAHGERASFGSGPVAQLRGPVGELALWVFDRKPVADVDLSGSPDAVARLDRARLSV